MKIWEFIKSLLDSTDVSVKKDPATGDCEVKLKIKRRDTVEEDANSEKLGNPGSDDSGGNPGPDTPF